MSIIRNHINFSADFVQIPNRWMRDGQLSHRARGILAEVMTHSDGWEITVQHLVANGTEGREAIRSAIKELVEHGYLKQVRMQREDGRMKGSQYVMQAPPHDLETTYRAPRNPSAGGPGAQESPTKKTNSKNINLQEDHVPAPKRATALPSSWTPTEEHKIRALKGYLDVTLEAEKFRLHAEENGRTAKNWNAAFTRWLINAEAYRPKQAKPTYDPWNPSTYEEGD